MKDEPKDELVKRINRRQQRVIKETLNISNRLLSRMLLFSEEYMKEMSFTCSTQDYLYLLAKEILEDLPFGLEAGSKVIFRGDKCLRDYIEDDPMNLLGISEFALYVADKWRARNERKR